MHWIRRRIAIAGFMAVVATGLSVVPLGRVAVAEERYTAQEPRRGFDDKYIFSTTRSVNDIQGVNPALKLTLFPVTVVLDTLLLPFAVIAGFVA